MAKEIIGANIPYPDFKFMEIIQPDEFDENNKELQDKLNETIDQVNINSSDVENLKSVKADKSYVDSKDASLQSQITANKTAYETKDTDLQNQITNNKKAYETKDTDLQNQINTKANKADVYTKTELNSGQLNNLYYTKGELSPFLRGGDTIIKEEVFIIVDPNYKGEGQIFFYTNSSGDRKLGTLLPDGSQAFFLEKGRYVVGQNRVEVIINDTLRRSPSSGGVNEIDSEIVAITQPEGTGAKITIKYYERIGVSAEYNIKLSPTSEKPPMNDGKNMWFEIIG